MREKISQFSEIVHKFRKMFIWKDFLDVQEIVCLLNY
jgi:hypothetical protein